MNQSHASRTPIHFLAEGRHCVRVPLAGDRGHAELYAEDMEALTTAGTSLRWSFNSSGNGYAYVKAATHNNMRTVARLLMQAGPGEQVDYLDGNPRNLRRDNLRTTRGGRATVDCGALLALTDGVDA